MHEKLLIGIFCLVAAGAAAAPIHPKILDGMSGITGFAVYDILQCRVSNSCMGDEECLLALENETGGHNNAHVQDCNRNTYAWKLCCTGPASATIQTSCPDAVLELGNETGGTDNAHVGAVGSGFPYKLCMSDVFCEVRSSCSQNQTCVLNFQNETGGRSNAHAAACGSGYVWKLCCGAVQPGGYCGDGTCAANETEQNCPLDCYVGFCGDGICGANETVQSCPQDCNATSVCGNGICEAGETFASCPADCNATVCGNGICEPGETFANCPQDCNATSVCGNGICEYGENSANCAADCVVCGDNVCDAGEEESCPQDCSQTAEPRQVPSINNSPVGRTPTPANRTPTPAAAGTLDAPAASSGYGLYVLIAAIFFTGAAVYFLVPGRKKTSEKKGKDSLKDISKRLKDETLQQIAQTEDVYRPNPYLNKLITYIDEALNRGYRQEAVENTLLQFGWKASQVKEGFERRNLIHKYHKLSKETGDEESTKRELAKQYPARQVQEATQHYIAELGRDASKAEMSSHLHQLAEEFNVDDAGTSLNQVVSYIRKCYAYGYNRAMITKILRQNKWGEADINLAFQKVL